MAKLHFNIGAEVRCKDGVCGKLSKVVVDPHSDRVTHLVVEKGLLLTTDRVLPSSTVESASGEQIQISASREKLADYPEYRDIDFREIAEEWAPLEGPRYRSDEVLQYGARYGPIFEKPPVPILEKQVRKNVRADLDVLGRGTPVNNKEGEIGKVDHLLVDSESGEVTHLIVDTGLLDEPLVVPVSKIVALSEEGVAIHAEEKELKEFDRYTPRQDPDIEAELEARIKASSMDLSSVEVKIENGLIRLDGVVPDVKVKRHAEAIARATDGVIDVENKLSPSAAVKARVVAALSSDPRTDLASIDVINEQGLITLKGEVDHPTIGEAAKEIATEQEGVVSVINELEVNPDKATDQLRITPTLIASKQSISQ